MPYYGRAWSTSSSALNATTVSAAKYGASVAVLYGTPWSSRPSTAGCYDPVEGVAWTTYQKQNCTATYGCVNATRELYYDDAQTLRAKYDLINELRHPGRRDLGARLRRVSPGALPGAQGQVHHRHDPAGHQRVDRQPVRLLAQRRRPPGEHDGQRQRDRADPLRLGRGAVRRTAPPVRRSSRGPRTASPSPTPGTGAPPTARRRPTARTGSRSGPPTRPTTGRRSSSSSRSTTSRRS